MGKKNNDNKGNSTNRQIQQSLSTAGRNVNYKEASAVAAKTGVSVDRVYSQTARTGQGAVAGGAAANAGYIPGGGKVAPRILPGYITQSAANSRAAYDKYVADQEAAAAAKANGGLNPDGTEYVAPEFDWQAWNAQMMAQQAAVWESMDAMNSEFLTQQQAWLEQQRSAPMIKGQGQFGGSGNSADPAAVKRKKRTKSNSGIKTNTGLSTGSAGGAAGSGLSLGGANGGNGLSIGKG